MMYSTSVRHRRGFKAGRANCGGPRLESLETRFLFAATDITGLTLYNADTGQPFGPLTNNETIDYSELGTHNLSVRATTAGLVGSVKFGVDGNSSFQVENYSPYSIRGD